MLSGRKQSSIARLLPDGLEILVASGQSLLDAALAKGLAWPYQCKVGSCGHCRARLVSGKIVAVSDFAYVLSPEELSIGFILACQSRLAGPVEIELPPIALRAGRAASEAHRAGDKQDSRAENPELFRSDPVTPHRPASLAPRLFPKGRGRNSPSES
jgi:ferredoxin